MAQGPLANLLRWQWEQPGLDRPARTPQFAAPGFDVSFQEIAGTLGQGGTLVLVPDDTRRDPAALLGWLRHRRIERLFLPVVALRHLAEAAGPDLDADNPAGLPPDLENVVVAGEALRICPAIRRFFTALQAARPAAALHNHYGPTESHVVTAEVLAGDPARWPDSPGIGRPIDNAAIHLLDREGQPVPPGLAGELWIGGPVLARGYAGRPDLTAERFITGTDGRRLYRTGDSALWGTDGRIDYRGRADRQVKIRGFRVEPEEVERTLERHGAVASAAVLPWPAGPGDMRLVGYASPRPGRTLDPAGLRAHLLDSLPEYMVPARLIVLDAMPLTASGKLDRRRLPPPVADAAPSGDTAGLSPVVAVLVGLWAALLDRPDTGPDADFFTLGGHSLLAARLTARIRQHLGAEVPLSAVFAHPTPRALAAALPAFQAGRPVKPAITPRPRPARLPLSFAQERLWLAERMMAPGVWNMPSALEVTGPLDLDALRRAGDALLARHEILRTRFVTDAQGVAQRILTAGPVPFTRHDLTGLEGAAQAAERDRLLLAEALAPIDIAAGPMLRLGLLALAPDRHVVTVVLHHIAGDAWTISILVAEFCRLYAAFAEGRPDPLPPPPLHYADVALWQREVLTPAFLAPQEAYWLERLADLPKEPALPPDFPRPATPGFQGRNVPVTIPPALADRLRALARAQGVSLFMLLLAGLSVALHRRSRVTDMVLGAPFAGRDQEVLEEIPGFFVVMLPLRLDLSGNPTGLDLLDRVRRTVLDGHANQDPPLEPLARRLDLRDRPAHCPLYQVTLALQNAPSTRAILPGLSAAGYPLPSTTAKYDLVVSVTEEVGGITGLAEYDIDLFAETTIASLMGDWQAVLEALVADPAVRLADLTATPALAPGPDTTGDTPDFDFS